MMKNMNSTSRKLAAFYGTGVLCFLFIILVQVETAFAQANLTVTPISWDVVGLDSNRPTTEGPQYFPVGAEVCNNSGSTKDIEAKFAWGDADATYIKERAGSLTTLTFSNVADGECVDAYYEIELTRAPNSFGKTREYSITASYDSGAVSASTPVGRQIVVEQLVSQNRNTTRQIRYCDPSVAGNNCAQSGGTGWVILGGGGSINLSVGGKYFIELETETSTSYEEVQSFLTLSNTIFQVLSVSTTYDQQTAPISRVPNPNPQLWADGCLWDSDPDSPNYHSCLDTGKAGGVVTTLYEISIIAGGGDTVGLEALIYDRSGGSFHYNTDYSQSPGEINVFEPVDANFSKRFIPSETYKDGTVALRFNITNIYPVTVSGYNFSDTLPNGMVVAASPNASSTCGGTVTAAAGSGTVSFADGEIGPNGSCTIRVDVTVPANASATYPLTLDNQSDNLFIGTTDTGKQAIATLTVTNVPPPPMTCAPVAAGTTLAAWATFDNASNPTPTITYAGVTATAQGGSGLNFSVSNDSVEWRSTSPVSSQTLQNARDNSRYYEFRVDTTGITSVNFALEAFRRNNGAPGMITLDYGPEGGTLTQTTTLSPLPTQNNRPGAQNFSAAGLANLNTSGYTVFRIYAYDSSNVNQPVSLLDVEIQGEGTVCTAIPDGSEPNPPSLAKIFSPNPVRVGEVSTLTFTLNNPNTSNQLTGVTFRDELPDGMQVAGSPAPGGTCTGTWNPAAGDTVLSFTGGTLGGSGNCTITVNVIATSIGDNLNLTDPIDATETLPGNSAEATLTVQPPPETPSIAKLFSPNPLLDPTASTTLTFKITNNDPTLPISSVAFTDQLPLVGGVQMEPVSPLNPTYSNCGASPSLTWDGTNTLSFNNGEIPAATVCTVTIPVTVTSVDVSSGPVQFPNVTSTVSHVFNGTTYTGNTASATLLVDNPIPSIKVEKKAGLTNDPNGDWLSYLPVANGTDVYYLIKIENTGEVPLSPVMVTDPVISLSGCTWPTSLPVATFGNDDHIATCIVGPVPAQTGEVPNTATASGTYNGTTVTDDSTANYATTALTIAKTSAQSSFTAAGDTLSYSYVVTNSGYAPLLGPITVTDDKTTVTCPAVNTVGDLDNWLEGNESLTCTATYTVLSGDVTAGSVTNTATATVGGVNSNIDSVTVNKVSITAADDSTTTAPNTAVTTSVTTNDTTLGGTIDNSSVSVTTQATNGNVTCNTSGQCIYTPNTGYTGTDTYIYQVCLVSPDQTTCDTAVVNVTINPTITAADDSTTTAPNTAVTTSVTTNDTNVGGTIDNSSVSVTTQATNGNVTCNTSGQCIYTPNTGYTGTDTYIYQVCLVSPDQTTCDTAVVNVTINPTITAADDSTTTAPNTAVTTAVTGNDTNVGGTIDNSSVSVTTQATNGNVTCNTSGQCIYTPNTGYTGTDTYIYQVCLVSPDQTTCDTAVVNVTINPTITAADDSATTAPNTAVTTPVTTNDTHVGGTIDNSSVSVTTQATNGNVTCNTSGQCIYTPNTGYTGTDTYTYEVCLVSPDQITCDTAVVNVTINPTITAADDSTTTAPNTAVTTPVTTNDTHVGGTIDDSSVNVTANPTNGTVNCTAASCEYTPNTGYTGTDTYTYQVCLVSPDQTTCDTATVTVAVSDTPTYALISSFKAYVNDNNQTVLEWKTDSEIGTIGFLLERLNEQTGEYETVSKDMLPSMLLPPQGGKYRFVDLTAEPNKQHSYRVVEIAVSGDGITAGPYVVTPKQALPVNRQMFADGPAGFTLAQAKSSSKQLSRVAARKEAAHSLSTQKKLKTGDTVKVPVSQDGLVYLTADELATASGLRKAEVTQYLKNGKCTVTLAGEPVSVLSSAVGSALWFYGQAPERNDIGQNIYLLELGKTKGVAITNRSDRAKKSVDNAQHYTAQVKTEENRMPIHLYVNKKVHDFWAWEYLLAYKAEASTSQTVSAPYHTGEGMATLTVNLVTVSSSSSGSAVPYKVSVLLNGNSLGTAEWTTTGDHQFQAEIAADQLQEEGNTVELISQLNSGVTWSFIYLDSIGLEYQRTAHAVDGELTFSSSQDGSMAVEGFSSRTVLALDITTPDKPVRVYPTVEEQTENSYTVIMPTQTDHRYYLTENITATVSGDLTADTPSTLHDTANKADYLIITPLHLMDEAQRLAEYRASQGLQTMVVDIDDVQDEFSSSLAAPEAVHDFLAYIHANWAHVPHYVVLVGDGSYDYKNYLGYGWPQVPTLLTATPEGFFPSDNVLADVVGDDGVPEFAIGRIPVVDNGEFTSYLEKMIAYEQTARQGGTLSIVVDQSDARAGDFQASADKIAALVPSGLTVNRLDVDTLGETETHNKAITVLQQGGGIIHYIGHSSLIAYGRKGTLLTADKIAAINGLSNPMLMVSMGCSSASFGYPVKNSIGESALLKEGGAAVGFFGATGLSYNYLADIMANGFYSSMNDAAVVSIGDAVLHAKQQYSSQTTTRYPLDIYNLLGDPAVSIPVVH